MKPAPPVMNCFTLWSLQVDRAVIAEHQARRTRALLRTSDIHVPPDERVGEPRNSHDATVLEHDRMLDLGVDDLAVAGDRGERADVRIDDSRPRADDRRPAHMRTDDLRALLDHHSAVDLRRVVDL